MTTLPSVGDLSRLDLLDYSFMRLDLLGIDRYGGRAALADEISSMPDLVADAPPRGRLADIFGTLWAEVYLVTDRFLDVLRSEQLAGWSAVRVTVNGNPSVPPVSMLQVTGRCGPILTPGIGRYLNPGTLDGSDLFVPANESTILLSPTATAALSQANLVNVEVEPAGLEPSE
ncbi:hypothetical protein OG474_11395 [Kribbella sp. NBC_01505]|uniref:hypothetical protein n=1 Tax=Kribbella sp. NBC_01505 TaxID=2903580 RepID=UPI00386DAF87